MSKQTDFIESAWFKATLFLVGCVFSQLVMATSPVANTPVNQSDYELLHQGRIEVSAVLFNAPCNLSFNKALTLTECGAGKDYQDMNLHDSPPKTPVTVRFYNAQHRLSSVSYPLSLLNGSNPIHIPLVMEGSRTLRLEVSYE